LKRRKITLPETSFNLSAGGDEDRRRKELYRMLAAESKTDGKDEVKKQPILVAWLQILRVPNLLTVPGDPIVGFFSWSSIRYYSSIEKGYLEIGSVSMLIPCILSVLMLYCAGLILNDLMDLNEDRRERRHRPLPSGSISVVSASVVAVLMFVGGLVAAWFNGLLCAQIAGVLSLAIVCYNAGAKRLAVIGPLNMGLCRGLSVFMGLAISTSLGLGHDPQVPLLTWEKLSMVLSWPFYSVTPMILYVAAVTLIASSETESVKMRVRQWLPVAVVAVWMPFLAQPHPPWDSLLQAAGVVLIAGVPVLIALACGYRLRDNPSPRTVQRAVAELVGNLLLIQAAAVYFNSYSTNARTEALPFAIGLGLAYPVFLVLCKRFYAS